MTDNYLSIYCNDIKGIFGQNTLDEYILVIKKSEPSKYPLLNFFSIFMIENGYLQFGIIEFLKYCKYESVQKSNVYLEYNGKKIDYAYVINKTNNLGKKYNYIDYNKLMRCVALGKYILDNINDMNNLEDFFKDEDILFPVVLYDQYIYDVKININDHNERELLFNIGKISFGLFFSNYVNLDYLIENKNFLD